MLGLRRLSGRGDTIIEVLIALAILGSALSMGFATASHALTTSRISQEHSEAQGYLDAQAELLRQAAPSFATDASNIYVPNSTMPNKKTFCMVTNGTDTPVRADFQASYTRPADAAADILVAAASPTPAAPYAQGCVAGNGRYFISIVYTQDTNADGNPDDLFSVYVRWEGISTLGRQQAVMTYKIHQATAGGGSIGGSGTPTPPPVPPAPTCAATIPTGKFDGCYYSDMNFGTVAMDRTDPAINFDWGTGSPATSVPSDRFSVMWRGNFNFNSSGNYVFTIAGDDGVALYIDGNPVTLSPGGAFSPHSSTTYTGTANISSGTHQVMMKYYEDGGYASASLSWAYTPPPPACATSIPSGSFDGCYYSGMNFNTVVMDRNDSSINFDWGTGSPDARVPADNFSAMWRGNFNFTSGNNKFTVTGDDGVALYIDGSPVTLSPAGAFSDHGPTDFTATVNLSGTHQVMMKYYENGGGALARLSWAYVPPPTPTNVVNANTSISVYNNNGCYYDYYSWSPIQWQTWKLKDGNIYSGITTNCYSPITYMLDLGAYYDISSISINWGNNWYGINRWGVATTTQAYGAGGSYCGFNTPDASWSYYSPGPAGTYSRLGCYGGSDQAMRYVMVSEGGYGQPISLNEIQVMAVPAP